MKFLKWLGIIILVISLFVALIYGGMEIYELIKAAVAAAADQNVDMITAALPHIKGIALVGADLALLITGFRDGRDLLRDADIDKDSRRDWTLGGVTIEDEDLNLLQFRREVAKELNYKKEDEDDR